jgi:transcriptional regulator with XRE-family HTH domain
MIDYQLELKIKKLAKESDMPMKRVAQHIGMTENGLAQAFKKNTLKVETLQKVGEFFEVPITYFFTDPEGMNNINRIAGNSNLTVQGKKNKTDNPSGAGKKSEAEQELAMLRQRVAALEKEVSLLERELKSKDEIINLLKQQR